MKNISSLIFIISSAFSAIFKAFRRQKLLPLMLIGSILLILTLIFGFLAFTPVLSPFIYPLF